jgi:hypothetical protein
VVTLLSITWVACLLQLGTIETMKLTMKELYSSRVENFRLLGRQSHPRRDGPDLTASIESDNWRLLGQFTAENKRGTQAFQLEEPVRARYVLLAFDTHYGNEQMCALNGIEVLGVSAAQELEEALSLEEVDEDSSDELELIEQQWQQEQQQQQTQQQQAQVQQQQAQAQQAQVQEHQQQQQVQPQQQQVAQETAQQEQQDQVREQQQGQQQQQPMGTGDSSSGQHQQADVGGDGAGGAGGSRGVGDAGVGDTAEQVVNAVQGGASSRLTLHQQQECEQEFGHKAGQDCLQEQQQHQAGGEGDNASQQVQAGQKAAAVGASQTAAGGAGGLSPAGSSTSVGGAGALREMELQQQQVPAERGTPSQESVSKADVAAAGGMQSSLLPSVVEEGQAVGHTGPSGSRITTLAAAGADGSPAAASGGAVIGAGSKDGDASTAAGGATPHLPSLSQPAAASSTGPGVQVAAASAAASNTGGHQPQQQQEQQPQSSTGDASVSHAPVQQQQQQQVQASQVGQQQHVLQQQQQPVASVNGNGMARPPVGAATSASPPVGSGVPSSSSPTPASAGANSIPVTSTSPPVAAAAAGGGSPPASRDMVLEGRGSTKPKQAGSLFDVIKSEMVQLKLEQGKSSKRIESLSKKVTELEGMVTELVQQNEDLRTTIKGMAAGVEALVRQEVQDAVAEMLLLLRAAETPISEVGSGEGGSGYRAGQDVGHSETRDGDVGGKSSSSSWAGGNFGNMCPRPMPVSVPWKVVLLLYASTGLGLGLAWFPKSLHWAKGVRAGVILLAAANGVLAVLINLWLILAPPHVFDNEVVQHVPLHRMLSNVSWS